MGGPRGWDAEETRPLALAASGLTAFCVQELPVSSGLHGCEQGREITPPGFAQQLQHGTAWKEITAEELRGGRHVRAKERKTTACTRRRKQGDRERMSSGAGAQEGS